MSRRTRDLEELAADIEKYDLLTQWVEVEPHVLKTKEEADEYFRERDCGEKFKAGIYARIAEGKPCRTEERRTKRQPWNQENGVRALEQHIEKEWTVGEILLFRHFLRGGDFVSPEGWKVGHSGMTFKTSTEDGELRNTWERLVARAYLLMGAICAGGTNKRARFKFGYADLDALVDYSITQLQDWLPDDIAGRLAKLESPEPPKPKRKRGGLTYEDAAEILRKLNCPRTAQTLKNWRRGKGMPEGFTPEKLESVEAFTAWAKVYANREQSKINSHNALRIDNPNGKQVKRFR